MDELTWVEYLKRKVNKGKDVIASVGDDCAIVRHGKEYMLLTSDLFIENIHFKRDKISLYNIGQRAVGRALSDIVSCAGVPRFVGISAGLPTYLSTRGLKSIFSGIKDYCRKYKVSIIGGDTARASCLFLDIWAIGATKKYVLRSGARVGDYIFVTGKLGRLKFNQPFSLRLYEIRSLVTKFNISAMIDVSDGFILDTYRIVKESGKGVLVYGDKVPVTRGMRDMFRGEDYEIIFTVNKSEDIDALKKKYFLVGQIKPKSWGYKIKFGNTINDLALKGYLHF